MKIFLDACIIIYWVESTEPFYSELIAKLTNIAKRYPQHTLAISRLSLLECLVKPIRKQDKKLLKIYQQFFESSQLSIIEIDSQVIDTATQLRAYHNLRTPDAIQAAGCLSLQESHLFLTNDKMFRKIPALTVEIV